MNKIIFFLAVFILFQVGCGVISYAQDDEYMLDLLIEQTKDSIRIQKEVNERYRQNDEINRNTADLKYQTRKLVENANQSQRNFSDRFMDLVKTQMNALRATIENAKRQTKDLRQRQNEINAIQRSRLAELRQKTKDLAARQRDFSRR